jgi:UDP-glucose 4-epimerase
LVNAGANVVGVDIQPPRAARPAMQWHSVRFEESAKFEGLLKRGDLLFHLISSTVPGSDHSPARDVSENLLPTLRLLDICLRNGVARVVFLSSGGTVYGPDVPLPTPEDAAQNPISWYGVQKLAVERYLSVYRRLHGLDSVALRVSNAYGPHQTNPKQGLVGSVIRHALEATPVDIFGDGEVIRDYVYVADVVEAILAAASLDDPSAPRVYNIGSGIGRSVNDVVRAVQAVSDKPIAINRLPHRAVDVAKSILDIARAEKYLAWRPRTAWEDAIALTYSWSKSEYARSAE